LGMELTELGVRSLLMCRMAFPLLEDRPRLAVILHEALPSLFAWQSLPVFRARSVDLSTVVVARKHPVLNGSNRRAKDICSEKTHHRARTNRTVDAIAPSWEVYEEVNFSKGSRLPDQGREREAPRGVRTRSGFSSQRRRRSPGNSDSGCAPGCN